VEKNCKREKRFFLEEMVSVNKALRALCFSAIIVLFALFFYSPVSSFHCDSGSLETTCTLSSNQTLPSAQSVSGTGNLVIETTADLNTNANDLGIAMQGFIENRGFNNSAQTQNLSDFPVLITLTTSDFNYARAQSDGGDLRFTDSDATTLLNYEIEDWNSDGNSHVWVKVPQIDASSSTDYIYMYYSNASVADGNNDAGVWDSSYKMVQHLDGTTHSDSTSNNNDGTYKGSSLSFDGDGDYISLGAGFVSPKSISAWVKLSSLSSGEDDIFSKWTGAGGQNIVFYVYNKVPGVYINSFAESFTTGSAISTDEWHHIVYVNDFNSTSSAIFVDGVLAASAPRSSVLSGSANAVFGSGDGGISNWFNGLIDEVRTYSRSLSLAEVQGLYQSTEPSSTGLTALWHFNEGTGITVGDDSGNANNGTITGANWSTSTRIVDASGKIDGADAFNGTDNFVDLSSISVAASGNAARSIFCWIKTSDTAANRAIISTGTPAASQAFNLVLYGTTPGIVGVMGYNNDFYPISGTPVNDGIWHQIGAVYDGAGNIKTYVDGVEDNSDSKTYSTTGQSNYIGKSNHVGYEKYFNGSIDDVRVSSTARDSNWIAASYLSGKDQFVSKGSEESGSWSFEEWSYRKPISIDNFGNSEALTDYQVLVKVPYNAHMKSDFSDLRFIDPSTGTELSYWVENYTVSTDANIWVKLPSIPAHSTKAVHLYYGNDTAASDSNGEVVFEFFDDFGDTSLDLSKWTVHDVNSPTVSGSAVHFTQAGDEGITSKVLSFLGGGNYTMESRHKIIAGSNTFNMGVSDAFSGREPSAEDPDFQICFTCSNTSWIFRDNTNTTFTTTAKDTENQWRVSAISYVQSNSGLATIRLPACRTWHYLTEFILYLMIKMLMLTGF